MKNRPQPKKISFIKINKTKNINKSNNKIINKKKQNNVLINNLIIINSPKNNYNYISSSNRINEKLFNKIKKYTLEANLLNQVINDCNNKCNNKENNNNNESSINNNIKNNQGDELRYNSLDNTNNNNERKFKKRNNINNMNKLYTDRYINSFIKNQNQITLNKNKNSRINTSSNNKYLNKKPQSLSKERNKNNMLNTNFKYTKTKPDKKDFNIKRNISASNRLIDHKKFNGTSFTINKKNFKRENEEEFNINNIEENDNLLCDIHTSYNLTKKNHFNFYYTDIQFHSSKNLLEKNKNKKIDFQIKEEKDSEQEFSFRKNEYKDNYEYKIINNNNIGMKNNRNKSNINKNENALTTLHKKGINFFEPISNDVLSNNSQIKGIFTPENLKYSLQKSKNDINIRNKDKNLNKFYILKKKNIFSKNNFNNNFDKNCDKENNKLNIFNNNIIYEKNNKLIIKESSLYIKNNNNKKINIIENNKNKSPTIDKYNKYNKYNYLNHKLYFFNSPNIILSNLNRNKNEYSYDDITKKNKKNKFQKINEENKSISKSKSQTKSKPNSIIDNSNNKLYKLIFIIKTNWGNVTKIGINNIKLSDKNNKNLPIKYSNYDTTKPYIAKYIKGESKKLIIGFDKKYNLKNIVIINGFNDIGVKNLLIENDKGKILWKGNIPKIDVMNIREYYISIDNYTNYNTNTCKKNPLFSKTLYLYREDNNNLCNFKYSSSSKRISQNDDNYETLRNNYEVCDRIKIKLIKNFGNRDYIGLSGIELYDNYNKLINILEKKKNIRINENIINLREKKILYNLFNNKNDTIDPSYMFLTTNYNAFINIEFKQAIKISKIIIYNYNNNIYKDCATKGILIYFYYNKKSNKIKKPIFLYMPPGEENIDYGQILLYPFDNNSFYDKKMKKISNLNLNSINYKMIYNKEYQYYSPFLPFGYILKIEIFSNYGNKNYIGIENIQLFDEENKEINLNFSSIKNNKNSIDYSNDSNYTSNINNNEINPRIFILPEAQRINPNNRPIILSKLQFIKDLNNDLGEKRIYFIFNECIALSRICIHNYNKNLDISAKDIKILLDDNIIFEGKLKKIGINNIYFSHKNNLQLQSNNISLSKRIEKSSNIFDNSISFLGKTFNYTHNKINYKYNESNEDRYIEYEGKNGAKILLLNTEL